MAGMQGERAVGSGGFIEAFSSSVHRALFGLGFIAFRDEKESARPHRTRVVLATVIDTAQMLAFVFSASQLHPWHSAEATDGLSQALVFVTPDSADKTFGLLAYQVMFILATVWATLFVALAVQIGRAFVLDSMQSPTVLRVFRAIASLSVSVLFLPVASVLLRAFACDASAPLGWYGTTLSCGSPVRIVATVILAVLLMLFLGVSVFVTATFVDREPGSLTWTAKAHGRVDVGLLLFKFLLTAVVNIDPSTVGSPLLTGFLIAAGVVWFSAVFRELPHSNPMGNAMAGASAMTFLWATATLAFAQGSPTSDFTGMVFIGLPLAASAGLMAILVESHRIESQPLIECRTAGHVLVWASSRLLRYRIQTEARSGISAALAESPSANDSFSGSKHGRRRKANPMADADDADASALEFQDGQPGEGSALRPNSSAFLGNGAARDDASASTAAAISIAEAEDAFRMVMRGFPSAGTGFAVAASFFRRFSSFTHQECDALARLKQLDPPFDLAFVVFVRSLELDGTGDEGSINHIDRVLLEQSTKEARRMRVEVLREQAEFWSTLGERRPDVALALEAGRRLVVAIRALNRQYTDMLRYNPESPSVLRAYAGFLADQGGNAARATELQNRADRLEETSSHKQRHVVRHVVLFEHSKEAGQTGPKRGLRHAITDESAAVITVSMAVEERSEIVGVSPAACRLLLASRPSALVGQTLSHAIIPMPFAAFHDKFVATFGRSVRANSSVVGWSRTLPVLRQDGTFEPMVVTIDEAPPDPRTLAPRMAAVLQPIPTEEAFLLFAGPAGGYRIFAASRRSSDLLRIEPSTLTDRFVSMLDYFPSAAPGFQAFPIVAVSEARILRSQPSLARNLTHHAAAGLSTARAGRARRVSIAGMHGPATARSVTGTSMPDGALGGPASSGFGRLTGRHPRADSFEVRARGISETGRGRAPSGHGGSGGLRVDPLLSLESTGLIPIEERGQVAMPVVAGSIQTMKARGMSVFMLRWSPLDAALPEGIPNPGESARLIATDELDSDDDDAADGQEGADLAAWMKSRDADAASVEAANSDGPGSSGSETSAASADENGLEALLGAAPTSVPSLAKPKEAGPAAGAPVANISLLPDAKRKSASFVGDPTQQQHQQQQLRSGPSGSDTQASRSHPSISSAKGQAVEVKAVPTGSSAIPFAVAQSAAAESIGSEPGAPDAGQTAALAAKPEQGRQESKSGPLAKAAVPGRAGKPVASQAALRSSLARASMTGPQFATGAASTPNGALSAGMSRRGGSQVRIQAPPADLAAGSIAQTRHGSGAGWARFDGASSVGSAGSTTTMNLTRSLSRLNAETEPEISRVRVGLAFTTLATLAAAVVIAWWVPLSTERLRLVVTGLDLSAHRVYGLTRAVDAAHHIHREYSLGRSLRNFSLEQEFELLVRGRDDMHNGQKQLHQGGRVHGESGYIHDQQTVVSLLEPPHAAGRDSKERNQSLADAESFMFGQLRTLSLKSWWDAEFGEAILLLEALSMNVDAVVKAFSLSLAYRHADLFALGPEVTSQMAYAGMAYLLLVVVVTAVLFLTAIRALAAKQREVMGLFLMVPGEAARAMRALSAAQLDRAVAEAEDAAAAEDDPSARANSADVAAARRTTSGGGSPKAGAIGKSHSKRGDDEAAGMLEAGGIDEAEMQRLTVEEEDMTVAWQDTLRRVRARAARKVRAAEANSMLNSHAGPAQPNFETMERHHVDSGAFTQRSMLWLFLPIWLVAGWLLVVVFVAMEYFDTATEQATRIIRVVHAAEAMAELTSQTHRMMLTSNSTEPETSLLSGNAGLAVRIESHELADEALGELALSMERLMFGGQACTEVGICETLNPLTGAVAPEAYNLLSEDGCRNQPDDSFAPMCSVIEQGVMDGGLLTASGRMIVQASHLIRTVPDPPGIKPNLMDAAHAPLAVALGTLHVYTENGLERVLDSLRDRAYDLYSSAAGFAVPVTWGFVATYAVIVLLFFWAQVVSLSRPLRNSRELAKLLPPDLVEALPYLRIRLRDVAGASVVHSTKSKTRCSPASIRQACCGCCCRTGQPRRHVVPSAETARPKSSSEGAAASLVASKTL
ncbi:hypothetical protein FNF28_06804 [Cafeteria roenbergensis]|uniref:TmcB/TmcC TPR repeats domain-containing protein n=1 Tax=Cafeteria roenbergensis TaxID=33653 RepID=A0A5A8CPI2_CAFRO|nr:hypothetical protein FNF28_06804 [Cafeteria roenbergensis]